MVSDKWAEGVNNKWAEGVDNEWAEGVNNKWAEGVNSKWAEGINKLTMAIGMVQVPLEWSDEWAHGKFQDAYERVPSGHTESGCADA